MKKPSLIFVFIVLSILYSISLAQELKPGDGVRITLYNISDAISGDYFAQQDGFIQLPYIGLIQILERDFLEIRSEIITKYDSLYKNPEITVQPLFKINILGEVKRPGQYYVTGVETILDIVALAGGETQDANLNKLSFIRDEERININPKELIEKGSKVQDIGLKSGDQVIVPRGWWVFLRNASVIVSFAALAVTIIALSNR